MKTLADTLQSGPSTIQTRLRRLNGLPCIVRQIQLPLQRPVYTEGTILTTLDKLMVNTDSGRLAVWCSDVRDIAIVRNVVYIELRPGIRLKEDIHG